MNIKYFSVVIFSSILFILGSFSSFTYLQYEQFVVAEEKESEGNGQRRPHRGPPPESKEACSGKSEGDSCGFTSPYRGEINGDCRTVRNGDFACVPEGGPPGRRDGKRPKDGEGQRRSPGGGPPPESKEACSGKNEGDSCGFTSPYRGEINGDCRTVKNGDVACVPEGGPPGRGGNEGSRDGKDSPGY